MNIRISFGREEDVSSQREYKGKSLLAELQSYVVLDLETTGLDPTYDNIIEIAAVKVENGSITDQFQTLVNPGYEIDGFITELTGITNDMLSGAPDVTDILPQFLDFVGDSVVVAHNANFDVNFLYDACESLQSGTYFKNDFLDTMRLSRRLFREQRHHRLSDLTERFGIEGAIEHRALSDVLKTNQCYVCMKGYAKNNGISIKSLYPTKSGVKASDITAATSVFDETSAVFEKVFVFTGTLQKMVRKDAMQLVVNMGGKCGDGVTKDTNYLVLGNNDYCASIKDGKSSKQKKAEKYKATGMDIEIISENVFYDMISENTALISPESNLFPVQENQCPVDDFEKQCLLVVQKILPNEVLRYNCESKGLQIYTCFWGFLTLSKMKKGYFVQTRWDFDLSPFENLLTCETTKSCKRIFIDTPEDLYTLENYIIEQCLTMQKSWNDYLHSVSSSTSKKRAREYEETTYPIPQHI